jgi:plastocyanin
MRASISLLAAAVLAAAALPAAAQGAVEVRIDKYQFEPKEVRVKSGTTVKWINDEKRTSHSVLFTGAGGFESERMFPGESWERKFDKPGTYPYTCGPHPEMNGVVEVAE